ncbi:4-carboxy-4-hydroxy-2-oxoadipate aldolase/oxaloacetate decarboxylase [Streptomyces diacarni]|uniref:Putative 4-hydroxy-4-methyl-2-oxoglutarate aldolase n=1 Tax=Streptomyces diacarni TaxID=2800381 RepID=A0A367F3A0_9ACTN|nr:4-carboxy-4-hydroxy-2-oxoadipate aldolase/oxaloacetate decarboxylase [Streptomyces diacarni]RCG24838.1 4-carboxy-4-hydroxy-2-oxoadipate aldolase/oxaloacetate decarboxylase [Streptomyces diacarni]
MHDIGVVHRTIDRPPREDVEALAPYGVSTLHEAMGRTGLMRPHIRPVYPRAACVGTAVTVLLQPGDNWMLHVAAEQLRPGDLLVAACTTECEDGFFGELLATSVRARGAVGLVIDGGCRDVDALEAMDFPVFSRAVNAKGTVKATVGSVNVPLVCANALVRPGDVVAADSDGVVVVPAERLREVTGAARAREENEAGKRARFAAGELGLDMYGMREPLKAAGLRYVD